MNQASMQPDVRHGVAKTSDGCDIAYTLRPARNADSRRVVLIHSLALDRSIWESVATALSAQADVLYYDCRGHGRSGHPVMPYTCELFARDLAELMDHIGWQSAAIAGCSMGGCVAQAFGGLYSARTTALGLIDTTAWYGADAPQAWRERAANARAKGLAGMIGFQLTRWFGDQFRSTHPEVLKAMSDVFLANDLNCYASTCEMLGTADLRPYLPFLRMPVAIVVGEEDYATPIAEAEALHKAIPQSTLTVLPGGRHLTPVECPDKIAAELLALFDRA